MGSLTAPPGTSVSPVADAAQALFMEARRRRRRRWLARTAAALVVAAAVAVCAVIWLPGASDQAARRTGAVGGLARRPSAPSWRARVTYRVVTAGVFEAYGTWNLGFSGNNRSLSFSEATLATDLIPRAAPRAPEPPSTESGTERIVDGQVYVLNRAHGRLGWLHDPAQEYIDVNVTDPRTLVRVLAPFARFQAAGYQVIGGVRLKVLRATDPRRLTDRALLPVVWTSGQPVSSLEIWVDRHGVTHRMAFTFRAPGRIILSTPVSRDALAAYRRAEHTMSHVQSQADYGTGRGASQVRLARRHFHQALLRAFPIRHGYQVTATTVIFTAIGQPQHITAPQNSISSR